MSGIYIHIPFCKTKCTYCDFYKSTNFKEQKNILDAMLKEFEIRKDYIPKDISTLYFGGGTPSTFSAKELQLLIEKAKSLFTFNKDIEITLEANPDDLSLEYLQSLRKIGINRLSIGIQSFDNAELKKINRRHTGEVAIEAVKNAQNVGFDNISIDLIFGLPEQSIESWIIQLETGCRLDVQHISSYGLTYEKNTALWTQYEKGKVFPTDDDTMNKMYEILCNTCKEYGFEQYEISNFAKKRYYSKHNSSYWEQIPYLGIGPSAHSYNGNSRQWNVSSISEYYTNIFKGAPFSEMEILSNQDKYNDYIMVRLRTIKGIDLEYFRNIFGEKSEEGLLKNAEKFIKKKLMQKKEGYISLTPEGINLSNQIISDLMIVD